MATIQDQRAFENAVATAQATHQNAIQAAQSAYECGCREAQAKWKERLDAAKARYEAIKNDAQAVLADIRQEYHDACASSPDFEAARQQLVRDVDGAGAALNTV